MESAVTRAAIEVAGDDAEAVEHFVESGDLDTLLAELNVRAVSAATARRVLGDQLARLGVAA